MMPDVFTRRVHKPALLPALCLALFFYGGEAAKAQSPPPLKIPIGGPFPPDANAIVFNGWQLRGGVDAGAQASNNFLLTSPPSVAGLSGALSPHFTADWSNGIHATSLYGYYSYTGYRSIDAQAGEFTFRQTYSPLRDVTLSLTGDYTHQTLAANLTSSIPGLTATSITPSNTTVLANGNTLLPNGSIVSPTGQVVGQSSVGGVSGSTILVNPFDQYTATLSAEKMFPYGLIAVSASATRVNYELAASQDQNFSAGTVRENAAIWLGPMFYAYSDGAYSARANSFPNPNSSAFRVVAGLGSREFVAFQASAYAGYQGSLQVGTSSASGAVFGALVTYDWKPQWRLRLNFDETVNIASGNANSTVALSLPNSTALLLPTTASADISTVTLGLDYRPFQRWVATAIVGETFARYLGSSQKESGALADFTLQYTLTRNWLMTLEYQYTNVLSNVPNSSAIRQLGAMRASYKF